MERKDTRYFFPGTSSFAAPTEPSAVSPKFIPTSDFGLHGSGDNFSRQDSLAMCSQLQGNDDMDMFNNICDLTPYMAAFDKEEPFGGDIKESLEPMMEKHGAWKGKQMALLDDIDLRNNSRSDTSLGYAMLTNCGDAGGMFENPEERYTYTPEERCNYTPDLHLLSVKEENTWEDQEDMEDALTPGPSVVGDGMEAVELPRNEYVPRIKPRKYNLKPDNERKNHKYLQARAKNNDAVRKSRMKKKSLEEEREKAMDNLKNVNAQLEQKCLTLEEENRSLKKKYEHVAGKFENFKHQIEQKGCRHCVYHSK